jgi:hypothetical protein
MRSFFLCETSYLDMMLQIMHCVPMDDGEETLAATHREHPLPFHPLLVTAVWRGQKESWALVLAEAPPREVI